MEYELLYKILLFYYIRSSNMLPVIHFYLFSKFCEALIFIIFFLLNTIIWEYEIECMLF